MQLTTHPSARAAWRAGLKANAAKYFPSIAKPSLTEWIEKYLILPAARAAKSGPYRIDETPYVREILDVLADDEHDRVVVKKAARLGLTEAMINGFLGYTVATDPGPIMVVWPTKDDAMDWSKEVLPDLFETTLPLIGKLNSAAKASDNTILHKAIPGGHIHMVGSNSPRSLRRKNIRYLLFDELDACAVYSKGREGSVVKRAERRTTTYDNRKIVLTGSPELLETSQIHIEYERSDQRRYEVPCPICECRQTLVLPNLRWDKWETKSGRQRHRFETAHFVCIACGERMEHAEKKAMVRAGSFKAYNHGHPVAGFWLNAFVSLFANATWPQMAEEYYQATKIPEEMIVFVNTILGEAFEDRGGAPEEGALLKRRETWRAEVPMGVGVLTAGVDVQDSWIELLVVGHGVGQESWHIAHHRIIGDTEEPEVWARLDRLLGRPFLHESGIPIYIQMTMVDAGDEPERVHDYTRPRRRRNIWSLRGEGGRRNKKQPMLKRSKSETFKNTLFLLDVDRCKDILMRRLRITEPGPGMIHFPMAQPDGLDDEYLKQFANVKKIVRKDRQGREIRHYADKGRVEAPDITNYAYAALLALGDAVVNELPQLVTDLARRGEIRKHAMQQGTLIAPAPVLPPLPPRRGPRLHSKVD